MSVELEPVELGFKRPFTHEVSQILRLQNPNSEPVAFKVKTTAPKQYCVRPNSGRIEAGQAVEVQVLLQAMKEDPPLDFRCRDKFLVQSVIVPSDRDYTNVTQVWSHIEQEAKSSIQEKKIRVNFLPAEGTTGAATAAATNGISHHEDEHPPAYSSPSAPSVTPQRETRGPAALTTPSNVSAYSLGSGADSAHNPTMTQSATSVMTSSVNSAAASIASAIPTSREDVQKQLDAANAQIKQLQQQLQDGLRQRKVATADEKSTDAGTAATSTSMQNAPSPGGVPIHIVAILCVLCFLLAYFLF